MPDDALYVLLWTDDDGAQCALYTDQLDALIASELVGGRVECRVIHRPAECRESRFSRA